MLRNFITSVRRPATGALSLRAYNLASGTPPFILPKSIPHRLSCPFSTFSVRGRQSVAPDASTYETLTPPINWGVCVVHKDYAYVIERWGKYHVTLYAGIHVLIPVVDKIAYVHPLMEQEVRVLDQRAKTRNGVPITVDVDVYVMIVNPVRVSYAGVNPYHMIIELAHSAIVTELAKVTSDDARLQRETLGQKFTETIDGTIKHWGFTCCGCAITNMRLPEAKETPTTKLVKWLGRFPGLLAAIEVLGQVTDFMIPLVQREAIEAKGGK